MGKNDFHGSLGQVLPLPSRAPYGKTLERVPKFSYLGVVLDGEPFLYGKITSSMLAARSVGGLGFCLVYDHASRRKPLNRYTHHFCSTYMMRNKERSEPDPFCVIRQGSSQRQQETNFRRCNERTLSSTTV